MKMLKAAATAATLAALACASAAQPLQSRISPAAIEDIRTCAERMAATDVFSGVLLIEQGGRTLLEFSSAANGSGPFTMDTPFHLASASKMFTAVAIAQLAEQKQLRFDDQLGRYLKELPPELAKVRIDQALTHSGGVRGLTQLTPAIAARIQAARTARELVPLVAEAGLAFAPGSKSEYSNGGFVLLGAVVEVVSGKTFREYVTDNVLAKAGMTNSSFVEPAGAPVRLSRMAPGAPPGGRARTRMGAGTTPAGGWYASARDLDRFIRALRDKRLVGAATLDLRLTTRTTVRSGQSSASSDKRGYGYGFGIVETATDKIVGHNGGAPGTNSEVAASVRSEWAAIALSNIDPPAATNLMAFARHVILTGSGTVAECDAIAATPGPFELGARPRQLGD